MGKEDFQAEFEEGEGRDVSSRVRQTHLWVLFSFHHVVVPYGNSISACAKIGIC